METNEIREALEERDGAIQTQLEELNTKAVEIGDRLREIEQRDPGASYQKTGPRFDLMRVVKAITDPKGKLDGYELEWHQEFSNKSGLAAPQESYWIPHNVKSVDYAADSPTAGGSNLVETELAMGSFVDLLRQASLVMRLGATEIPATGDLDIPKASDGATANWVSGDGQDITESTPSFSAIQLRPTFCSAYVGYNYRMGLQTGGAVEQILLSDMAAQIGAEIDKQAIQGDGSNGRPTGILNQSGINSTNWTASPVTATWLDIVELEKLLIDDKVPMRNLHYLADPIIYKACKTVTKDAAGADLGAGFLADFAKGEATTNGWPLHATTHVPANTMLLGDFSELLIANWGGVALASDPYTGFKSGTTYLRAMYPVDVAVRHAVSFAKAT